ncbi:MAG TPA: nickel pincer cofactor biosynthesis protein LarC [Gemmatimonadaceae bacterium]|jgi:pyridinium-3,5-bisthiocarboxylic acid mononucleotide nickel chelatase|nr:nickel pincer cofactor biosynthesis protein LarC [Gemmatimonadaceae bacterium]
MPIAILDPFSGIAGDMTLGALLQVGLDPEWLRALPARLGLTDVRVEIREVLRGEIVCAKVDFEIPPQPHGRHIKEIRDLVARSGAPAGVRERADRAFTAIATAEGEIHGLSPEEVHLHEVGAVDAILDVVGAIWGLEQLAVDRVFCGPIALGDGTVRAAHGILPVPAPATLKLLEGHAVRPGPDGAGELVTPTGAALVRVLSQGAPPATYVPLRSGFGAGTKDFRGRANALRIVLAEAAAVGADDGGVQQLAELVCDIDDMTAEYLAAVGDRLRADGALDVVMLPATMKRGRPGVRVEVLCRPADAPRLETTLLIETTTIGVRRRDVERRALPRDVICVTILGHDVRAKRVVLPDGTRRTKPELSDVERVALATGRPLQDIFRLAAVEAERQSGR